MGKARMIDSREVKHKSAKLWLWIVWLVIMCVSIAYCALSFLAFQRIMRVYNHDNNGVDGDQLWSVLAATFIGPFTVAAFFAFGTLLLLRKTVSESGLTYSFGALHFSALWMAVVVLQSAVSLQGETDTMKDKWERSEQRDDIADDLPWASSDTGLSRGAYVFAYILAFFYVVLFITLFVFRSAAKKLIIPPETPKALTSPLASDHKHGSVPPEAAAATGGPVPSDASVAVAAAPPVHEAKPAKKHLWPFGGGKNAEAAPSAGSTSAHSEAVPAASTAGVTGSTVQVPATPGATGEVNPVVVRPAGSGGAVPHV